MRVSAFRFAVPVVVLVTLAATGGGPIKDSDLAVCRSACQRLGSGLMSALGQALRQGGPTQAISVCREKAPALAAEISKDEGMNVRRTALRVRNPANSPDAWERQVLEGFQRRLAAGEDGATLEVAEVTKIQGKPTLRYMKAITTGEPCLGCHGEALAPAVAAAIRRDYPQDRATGFKKGDLRGAFSVRLPLHTSR